MIKIGKTKPINVIWDLIGFGIWNEIKKEDKEKLIKKLNKEELTLLVMELKLRGYIDD